MSLAAEITIGSAGGPVPTSEEGIAEVGPLRVPADASLRLAVGCTEHVCMTLKLEARFLPEGQSRILYHTLSLEKAKQERLPAARGGA